MGVSVREMKGVHLVLGKLATYVDNELDDAERQKLLDLAPRLTGANSTDEILSVRLGVFCARRVLHIYEQRNPHDRRPRKAIEAAERYADDPSAKNAAAAAKAAAKAAGASVAAADADAAAAAAAATNAAAAANDEIHASYAAVDAYFASAVDARWDFFVAVLDEYDRLAHADAPPPEDEG